VSLRCLIVDDNSHFRAAVSDLLEREGVVVRVASSSAEALAMAEQFHPDVTLVDIELGEESGLDLARQLAAAPGAQHSSVILCSVLSEQDVADLAADSPAVAYLPKSDLSATAIYEILASTDRFSEPPERL
jgi:CheY-like chemotaxis protein